HHTEFFANQSVLPTFNSDAIHVNMHRIPDIANESLLVNWCDDFFIGRPIVPEDWFRNGKPVVYTETGRVRGGLREWEDMIKARSGNAWLAKIYHTKGLIDQRYPQEAVKGRLNYVKHA